MYNHTLFLQDVLAERGGTTVLVPVIAVQMAMAVTMWSEPASVAHASVTLITAVVSVSLAQSSPISTQLPFLLFAVTPQLWAPTVGEISWPFQIRYKGSTIIQLGQVTIVVL